MELPIVNHQDYEAKLNDDNKFPIKKFGELAKYLLNQKVVDKFYKPLPCLLYTSPSPRDQLTSRMPSSA